MPTWTGASRRARCSSCYWLRPRRVDRDDIGVLLSRGSTTALLGRAVPEKVTLPWSSAARPGPTPRTRCNPSRDPKGPLADRSSTIRRASTPPIRGSDSISRSLATSISTIARGSPPAAFGARLASLSGSRTHRSAESLAPAFTADRDRARRVAPRRSTERPLAFAERRDCISLPRAESTAASCRASAWRCAASDAPPSRAARTTRTLAPRTMTPARKKSALRSAGVGMGTRSHRRPRSESSVYFTLGSFHARTRLC